jgi:hypothetical protein
MISIAALWMPLVLSAVAVFLVSSIAHMVLKYHQADYKAIPNQDQVVAELGKANLPPGYYQFPHFASMKECNTPEAQERFRRGPNGMITVMPNGMMNVGKFLGLWFVYCLLVSLFLAYLAGRTLAPGAEYLAIFRFVGTAAFLAYGLPNMVNSIWAGIPWSNTLRHTFDGLLYALVTAGVFGWLWPQGA